MKKRNEAMEAMSSKRKEIIDALNKIKNPKDCFIFIHRPANKNRYSIAIHHTEYREITIEICASYLAHLTDLSEDK